MTAPSPEDVELTRWYSACLRFFHVGEDRAAQAAIDFFNQHCTARVGESGAPLLAAARPPEIAAGLLRSAGLLDVSGNAMSLSEARYEAYLGACRNARTEAHRLLRKAKTAKLATLLEGEPVRPIELVRREGAMTVRHRLSSFVAKYRGQLGTHPFLKGLRGLLQRQVGDPMIWSWILAEESLTEVGGETFMEDAVLLLLAAFCYEGAPDGGELGQRRYIWEVSSASSDSQLTRLLRLLPLDSQLEGNATGELQSVGRERTNVNGEQDEEESMVAFLRDCCAVL